MTARLGGANDVYALAERSDPARRPVPRIDCGIADYLLAHHRGLHSYLEDMGYAHEGAESPGGHPWGYWNEHVRETLSLCGRVLGLERA